MRELLRELSVPEKKELHLTQDIITHNDTAKRVEAERGKANPLKSILFGSAV